MKETDTSVAPLAMKGMAKFLLKNPFNFQDMEVSVS